MVFDVLPAVDVEAGQSVRLTRGHVDAHSYGDPRESARAFINDGAHWIHLVDLDLAFGRGSNQELLAQIVADLPGVNVQLSGGVRDEATLRTALASGARRINLSTLALADLDWVMSACARFGDRVAVGLDVDGDNLVARGYDHAVGNLWGVLDALNDAGCARYVVTDKSADGMMAGANLDLLESVLARTDVPVVASGGVGSIDDVVALASLHVRGLEGVIIGKALYAGAVILRDVLSTVEDVIDA